ncbi:tyrosine-type recombinase/integrase [Dysosmobacter sp.]
MPRKNAMGRGANGTGSIRKKIITKPSGQQHEYWEARITVGYDLGTGKQIQRSITGKTKKEVREKMQQVAVSVNEGTYREPSKLTVGEWLDIWVKSYLVNCKPRTVTIYQNDIRLHIKPALGAIKLDALNTHTIQEFYNDMTKPHGKKGLSPKTVKNVHGVLHHALKQAVLNDYIRFNPADACIFPRNERTELKPLDEKQITSFLKVIRGHRFEDIFIVTLFTGMREGEILGLTWDCVDFTNSIITINKQMQLHQEKGLEGYTLVSTKNGKSRTIAAAPTIMARLKHRRTMQAQQKLLVGPAWEASELVFTDELGHHLTKPTVYRAFKKAVAAIGRPDARFHDLRHSYAVAAISAGDDIKTVQCNLGHATASFTLDVYGHVTNRMKHNSAERMESFIQSVSGE